MKFFDREDKIEKLRAIRERSATEAQFTVITGRRRVGKTMLVKHAFGVASFAYLLFPARANPNWSRGLSMR